MIDIKPLSITRSKAKAMLLLDSSFIISDELLEWYMDRLLYFRGYRCMIVNDNEFNNDNVIKGYS